MPAAFSFAVSENSIPSETDVYRNWSIIPAGMINRDIDDMTRPLLVVRREASMCWSSAGLANMCHN